MPNSFTLRDGQTVAIDFAQEPNLGDFTKLIALLELQRSFLDGSPAPSVVVDVRSAPAQQQQWSPGSDRTPKVNGAPRCRQCGKALMTLHDDHCGYREGRLVGFVSEKDCDPPDHIAGNFHSGATIVYDPPDAD